MTQEILKYKNMCADVVPSKHGHGAERSPPGCLCITVHSNNKKKEEKSMILFFLFMLPLLWSHLHFVQHPHACSYAALFTSLRLDIENIRYQVFVRPSQMSARTTQGPSDRVKSHSEQGLSYSGLWGAFSLIGSSDNSVSLLIRTFFGMCARISCICKCDDYWISPLCLSTADHNSS